MAPVIKALRGRREVEMVLVHTGQHYDRTMSESFIQDLGIPEPEVNLHTGSGSHAEQTAHMLLGHEETFRKYLPDLVMAQGDTNSVLSAGLAAVKLHIPFGHVEAGLRSFDRAMPEEINRVLADDCSQLCLAPTVRSSLNLLAEGTHPRRIFLTGNTVVDACVQNLDIALRKSTLGKELIGEGGPPLVTMTLHRAENTDDPERLHSVVHALGELRGTHIVFPIHPRARRVLEERNLLEALRAMPHLVLLEPLSYFDFLNLLWHSSLVLTDSGGVQEEALTLGVPCITLRENTERPETVELGANLLVGTKAEAIINAVRQVLADGGRRTRPFVEGNPLGDGRAGERIAGIAVEEGRRGFAAAPQSPFQQGPISREEITFPVGIHGSRVSLIRAMYPTSLITAVEDRRGRRLVPYHDLQVGEEWTVTMLATKEDQERLRVIRAFVAEA